MNGRRCIEMQEVRAAIQREFVLFQQSSIIDNGHPDFFQLLIAKFNNHPLRGFFTKKIFDYICEETTPCCDLAVEKLFPGKLPFILEVVITIQYYHNQILDGKGGIYTSDRIKQNLLLGNLLKDQLYSFVDQTVAAPYSRLISSYLRTIFKYTDLGQYIEKRHNTYNAYLDNDRVELPFRDELEKIVDQSCIDFLLDTSCADSPVVFDKLEFLRLYFVRIFLVSSSLFVLVYRLIKKLTGYTDEPGGHSLEKFAAFYGVMMQIVNDNCDWVPAWYQHKTVAKNYDDAFCDLKNRNVTYPLFLHLNINREGGSIRNYLESEEAYIPSELQNDLFIEIIESSAMRQSIQLGRRVGESALQFLNPQNSHSILLEDMTKISQFNRYYFNLFKAMKKIKIKIY